MKEEHLNTLGLSIDATDREIKAAYRKLSKQFHPDVNKSPEAEEKFIQINNAYTYLTNPQSEATFSFTEQTVYEEQLSEREIWRREYIRQQREQKLKAERRLRDFITKTLRYYRPVGAAILIFNVLLAVDFIIPSKDHAQQIIGLSAVAETSYGRGGRTSSTYLSSDLYTQDYVMRVSLSDINIINQFDQVIIEASRIFGKPMHIRGMVRGKEYRYRQIYSVFYIFGWLILPMLLMGYLFFRIENIMQRFNCAFVSLAFFLFQLFLFFTV